MRWHDQLTRAEKRHLQKEIPGRLSLGAFKRLRTFHMKLRRSSCRECRLIALKLGIE